MDSGCKSKDSFVCAVLVWTSPFRISSSSSPTAWFNIPYRFGKEQHQGPKKSGRYYTCTDRREAVCITCLQVPSIQRGRLRSISKHSTLNDALPCASASGAPQKQGIRCALMSFQPHIRSSDAPEYLATHQLAFDRVHL